jgi:hypothetical protein
MTLTQDDLEAWNKFEAEQKKQRRADAEIASQILIPPDPLDVADRSVITEVRRLAIALAQAIAEDARIIAEEMTNDLLVDQLATDWNEVDQREGCDHDWEVIIDFTPDYRIDKCMLCDLERSTDLHTGQETFVQP